MIRDLLENLMAWKASDARKPLILRGARQVGKSYIVRELAKSYSNYVEINFEENPNIKKCFDSELTPQIIIPKLEATLNVLIEQEDTLIFFDEIQICPNAITALRYFYEKMPRLHVIAAGSLLDFELDKIGVPVGRVEFRSLYPLSFEEFLRACNEKILLQRILDMIDTGAIEESAHSRLMKLLKDYMLVGGLPEAVNTYMRTRSHVRVNQIQQQLVTAYRQDFLKYAKKNQIENIELVFNGVAKQLGRKFKYVNISHELKAINISAALNLLVKARITHKIIHTASNGVPLEAEEDHKNFKCLCLDIGLALKSLGLNMSDLIEDSPIELINEGALAEQLVGQEMLANRSPEISDSLHYWRRESATSNAELDYVVSSKNNVIPIEVKAGHSGRLKSLQQFLKEKPQHQQAVRFYSGKYLVQEKLLNLPLYAVGAWIRSLA